MGVYLRLVTSSLPGLVILWPGAVLDRLLLEEAVGAVSLPVADTVAVFAGDAAGALAELLELFGFDVTACHDGEPAVLIDGWRDHAKLHREWPAVWAAISLGVPEYGRFLFTSDEGDLWVEHVAPRHSWRTAHELGEWGRIPDRLADTVTATGEASC